MTDQAYREQLVELGASLFNRGYSVGSGGNISLKLPDGNFLFTPTNSSLGRLKADELSLVDPEGNHLGGHKPTKEIPMHMGVYEARPDCNAIVHLHSTYATAYSSIAGLDPTDAFTPFTPYFVMKVGKLLVAPYYKPGSPMLKQAARDAGLKASAFLLANHGAVVCGGSLIEAANAAEELEETMKLYFLLMSSNQSIRYLTSEEISELTPAKAP
nr:aldolase [uncultured Cohaesibacter sp.]